MRDGRRRPLAALDDALVAILRVLLVVAVAVLVLPVSLQIFSRYTALIPAYIWTEEMARLLFVWMIMLGAMLGVREGSHLAVDLWPRLGPRAAALLEIVSSLGLQPGDRGPGSGVRGPGSAVHCRRSVSDQRIGRAAAPAHPHGRPSAGLVRSLFLLERLLADRRTLRGGAA